MHTTAGFQAHPTQRRARPSGIFRLRSALSSLPNTTYLRNLTFVLHTGQGQVISSMSWNRTVAFPGSGKIKLANI